MRAFVVADAHGNWEAVKGLLKQEGLDKPDADVTLVQVGDLANCVVESGEADLNCLKKAEKIFDVLLPGNHEHPYWSGDRGITPFYGFYYYPSLAYAIGNLKYQAAFEFGGVLVTHAGLTREHEEKWETAKEAADAINELWERDPSWDLFTKIGRYRGGMYPYGGILWSDWNEAKVRTFSQVVGHTPGDKIRAREHSTTGTKIVCTDRGAKKKGRPIGGAWISEDGVITPVVFDPAANETWEKPHVTL